MSTAQMETAFESEAEPVWQATGTDGGGSAALRQVVAERLAAHRNRRAAAEAYEQELEARTRARAEAARRAMREDQRRGASSVREAVMARYNKTESYREYLAHEAERALAQAQAEAEVANRKARAMAEAQMQLLAELDQMNQPEPGPREQAFAVAEAEARGELAHALADIAMGARELIAEPPRLSIVEAPEPVADGPSAGSAAVQPPIREISASGLTVRLFEDIPAAPPRRAEVKARRGAQPVETPESGAYTDNLDDEIEFRRAPEFETIVFETTPIPGNLIEFPRELIAARKARPRLAEGPLREELEALPQMRIFEVAPEQVEIEPELDLQQAYAPEWQSLLLEPPAERLAAAALPQPAPHTATLPLTPCTLERRLMAIAVDAICLGAAFVAFACAGTYVAGPRLQTLTLPVLLLSVAGTLAIMTLLYQWLFFSYSEATPGMRFARVGLCTFGDSNPSRRAMRRRILATALAACPLGLGLAWMFLDGEGLGWHDRMSRMYLRSY